MEKKKKLKFNIVDVIVVLVLLTGITFMAVRFIGSRLPAHADPDPEGSGPVDENVEEWYVITYFVPESADYIVDHLFADSPLTDDGIKLDLGILVDFETGPARISSAAADGHLVLSDREGYSSVYLMAAAPGIDNGYGVTVDGLKLEIGHSMVVRSKKAKFWAYVYDIQKLEDSPYADYEIPVEDSDPDASEAPQGQR